MATTNSTSMTLPLTSEPDKPNQALISILQGILENKYKNIVFMVGAGISTAAGIPDFRSPGTGLYDNLQRLDLPFPEAVFDIEYFKQRPEAFYTLAKDICPGKFEPTAFHRFIKWVDARGCLRRVYTQNIDTLERLAGVDAAKIVEAHGSFAGSSCVECGGDGPDDLIDRIISQTKLYIPHCAKCDGLVKPNITFFGEGLPKRFFECMEKDLSEECDCPVDLAIVAGTSLQVNPFATLPMLLHEKCPRVLFNMQTVGDFGEREDDVVVLGPLEKFYLDFPVGFDFVEAKEEEEKVEEKEKPAKEAKATKKEDKYAKPAKKDKEAKPAKKNKEKPARKDKDEDKPAKPAKEKPDSDVDELGEALNKLSV